MRGSSFARLMLVASVIALWCGGFFAPAAAQVTCTGTQTLTDGSGDTCSSTATAGPDGPGNATAEASDNPTASNATSSAINNSSATSNAGDGSNATASATNSSNARSSAINQSTAGATANDLSSADATAIDMGNAHATAGNFSFATAQGTEGGTANATADNHGLATAQDANSGSATSFDNGPGSAVARAQDNSIATATAGTMTMTSNGNALAEAIEASGATATVTTLDGFACAFAANGSHATGSDTAPPICSGSGAVVVSSAGNCGNAAGSDCAGFVITELETYFSNANTTGGQAFVNIIAPFEGVEANAPPAVQKGETCAMIYVFDTAQNMQACCGCPVTADGLLTLSISGNLVRNPVGLTSLLTDGSIRIVSTLPNTEVPPMGISLSPGENCDFSTNVCCDPVGRSGNNVLIHGSNLVAWAQHIQSAQITESEFQTAITSVQELNDGLPEACADILQLGTGAGQCSCPGGG